MVGDADTNAVTRIPWEDFQRLFARGFKQGEHVAIVGQTGSGKSVLGVSLCKLIGARRAKDGRPSRVVILANKPRDATVSALGWPVVKKWPPSYGQEHCIVWPRGGEPSTAARRQRQVFAPLLDMLYQEGGQTVYIDEASYFERPLPNGLALGPTMEQYWTSARSLSLSVVAGTQRPRNVSRSMWSEPSWVFVFTPDDEDDLRRVAELSGDRLRVMAASEQLDGHEFLCIRRQRGHKKSLYISKVTA